jgi:hypothetical protein
LHCPLPNKAILLSIYGVGDRDVTRFIRTLERKVTWVNWQLNNPLFASNDSPTPIWDLTRFLVLLI